MREIRPSEDLSMLDANELRHVFEAETIASLGLIEERVVAEPESFRPISAPLPSESPEPIVSAADDPISPHLASRVERSDAERVDRQPESASVGEAEVPRRDWLLDPEPIAAPSEAQPYGDDPTRMRELVQWFAGGQGIADARAASASVLVQRPAGDLVEGPPDTPERPHQLHALAAGERIV
ncbi:hypothetical protein ASG54_12145 [Aureimonas sp. Leaf460]|nr:hypothetical protein ASG62_08280 [Aureimonas sp. Leaf427]KQT77011.1 hypothetical protein ASG54_12145 [Aureimonas sp. Leaf460]